ncbi:hypothetical protein [Limobrevibacterium gyesilva]|uniref:Uncharacterized protein n=1 Tax=Limobrevibacterium gyesilva TaxID=2991712 RepID=A0AA41YTS1_9PROT|nr:hypothetical protein [Limobrevibacterium gyesilva]MCW3476335.1 hypothetical protein [Limobrevibacterium gyesilva]
MAQDINDRLKREAEDRRMDRATAALKARMEQIRSRARVVLPAASAKPPAKTARPAASPPKRIAPKALGHSLPSARRRIPALSPQIRAMVDDHLRRRAARAPLSLRMDSRLKWR